MYSWLPENVENPFLEVVFENENINYVLKEILVKS